MGRMPWAHGLAGAEALRWGQAWWMRKGKMLSKPHLLLVVITNFGSRMNECTLRLHRPVSDRSGHARFTYSVRAACMALSVGGEVIRKELSFWPCLRLMCLWLFYFPSLLTS